MKMRLRWRRNWGKLLQMQNKAKRKS